MVSWHFTGRIFHLQHWNYFILCLSSSCSCSQLSWDFREWRVFSVGGDRCSVSLHACRDKSLPYRIFRCLLSACGGFLIVGWLHRCHILSLGEISRPTTIGILGGSLCLAWRVNTSVLLIISLIIFNLVAFSNDQPRFLSLHVDGRNQCRFGSADIMVTSVHFPQSSLVLELAVLELHI